MAERFLEQDLLQEFQRLEQYVMEQEKPGKIVFEIEKGQLDIQLLRHCAAKCGFCSVLESQNWGETNDKTFLQFLSLYLNLIIPNSNLDRVIITGGEPTQKMDRLTSTIKKLQEFRWEVCSVITNGSRLTKMHKGKIIPELLAEAGLKQIAWSIHSGDTDISNQILSGYPETDDKIPNIKVDIPKGAELLLKNGIEMRINSTLQKHGVHNLKTLIDILEMASKYGFKDLYLRDLFDPKGLAVATRGFESHPGYFRNPQRFCHENRIDTPQLLLEMLNDTRFATIGQKDFETRDKSEFGFVYQPTGMLFYISSLVIGNETDPKFANCEQLPYVIYAQNGRVYDSYLEESSLLQKLGKPII
jgi:Radical SAM superfamily